MSRDRSEAFLAALRAASEHIEEALSEMPDAAAREARRAARAGPRKTATELGPDMNPLVEEIDVPEMGPPHRPRAKIIPLFKGN